MQAAALNRHEPTARLILRRYQHSDCVILGILTPVCTARLLGDAVAVTGDRARARGYYEQARDVSTRMRRRPEGALAALGLAEVLIAGNEAEQADAQPHLDFAIAELQEMRMQPALQRALANKELLKA